MSEQNENELKFASGGEIFSDTNGYGCVAIIARDGRDWLALRLEVAEAEQLVALLQQVIEAAKAEASK